MLREILTDAFSRETPMSEFVTRIQEAGVFSPERAQLIADTEVKFAMSRGNLEAWQKTGMVAKVKWFTSMLHVVPDECDLDREAGAIPIGEAFPGGAIAPPQHPRCRCSLGIAELIEPKSKAV
jgi:hypothetical protein